MRRLIMWNMVTLDGFFEGREKWDLGFHEYVWGDELERFSIEQAREADLILFGRVTYEGMAAYWPAATGKVAEIMNSIPKIVFSKTLDRADWINTRLVAGSADDEVPGLKQQPGKDILVFGSAELCASLTEAGLIDEYRLCVVPVILGDGTPLFKGGSETPMELLEARPLRSGGVILRYRPADKA
jgi:dihydrofolate reductase